MKKNELRQIIKEEIKNISPDFLKMFASYTDIGGVDSDQYNSSFEKKGMINKDKLGANGEGWGKKVILCSEYVSDEASWEGVDESWKYNVIFSKNIYEIYLDDEHNNLKFNKHQRQENDLYDYLKKNNWKNISLGILRDKVGLIVKPGCPRGTYVLNVKPNEIIKILKKY